MTDPQHVARTHRHRRVLRVLVGLITVMILGIGGTVGWAYLKFRAVPKIKVSSDVFNVVPDLTASTIAYPGNDQGATTPATSVASTSTPAVDTAATSATAASSASSAASTDTTPGVELAPSTDTGVTADQQAAIDAAAAADATDPEQVGGAAGKTKTTKGPKVVMDTVAPGPIVNLSGVAPFGGPNAQNYLMIGVDSRADVPKGQEVAFGVGQVGGSRTDTIIVLRIDRDSHQAWILSIPRDLWVPIAGGSYNRINSAFEKSANTLVRTIQDRLAIPIDHVVQVNFAGFQKIVDTVGGVEICFDYPTRDPKSGLNHPDPGCATLNGQAATAYVRSRHYQQLINGVWKEDPRSDLGRIVRQQQFIRLVLSKAKDQATNPLQLNSMLDDLRSAIAIDSTFTFPETAALANDFRSFDPTQLGAFTVPTKGARIQGKAVLLLDTVKGKAILGKFRGE